MSVKITCDKKERAIVWKGRLRPKREEKEEERKEGREGREGRVIMVGCVATLSSRNNALSPVKYRDNGTTLTYSNLRLHLGSTEDST